jgi:membrane-anchored protein YejM (alkaline phosphatase superfamily)
VFYSSFIQSFISLLFSRWCCRKERWLCNEKVLESKWILVFLIWL